MQNAHGFFQSPLFTRHRTTLFTQITILSHHKGFQFRLVTAYLVKVQRLSKLEKTTKKGDDRPAPFLTTRILDLASNKYTLFMFDNLKGNMLHILKVKILVQMIFLSNWSTPWISPMDLRKDILAMWLWLGESNMKNLSLDCTGPHPHVMPLCRGKLCNEGACYKKE